MAEDISELSDKIYSFLEEEIDLLDIRGFYRLSELAEAIGMDISGYENRVHLSTVERCSVEELPKLLEVYDENSDVIAAVQRRLAKLVSQRSLSEVAREAIEKRGWSQANAYEIKAKSKEQLIEWLKVEEAGKPELITQLLRMDASGKLEQVLKELASKSNINAMRSNRLYDLQLD